MTQTLIPPTTLMPLPGMLLDVGTQLAPFAWFCTAFVLFVVLALMVGTALDPGASDSVLRLRIAPRRAERATDRESCDEAA